MIEFVPNNQRNKIVAFFDGWDETLIWSCLQGHMGQAWADDLDNPSAAQIITGDFCFFAGNANLPQAAELVGNIPADYPRPWILIIPKDDSWHGLIEKIYRGKFEKQTRYAIKKEPDIFDRTVLHGYIDALPDGYTIVPIDEPLYQWTQTKKWARDFCSQFQSYAEYQKHGLGYVVMCDGEPVCGASSYTYYDYGIEIEIGTVEPHRRKGLATACAAKLILACLDRGLYPSWDAANLESVALAEKLGYHCDKEYVTYEITGFMKPKPQSWPNCDKAIYTYITGFVDLLKDKLESHLVGVYLHGSLAMGSYFPPKSDMDFIIVTKTKLDADIAKLLNLSIAQYAEARPTVGSIECSVITLQTAHEAPEHMPYELHYSESWHHRILEEAVSYGVE